MLTVTVNTLADVVDPNDAYISLREALLEPDPTVAFHPSLSGGRIVLNQGQLSVNKAITITGPGADQMTIDALGLSRVLSVGAGVNAAISGVTITGGYSSEGGGILNFGDLTLQSVVVSSNTSTNLGGGILSRNGATGFASLHVLASAIEGNFAVGGAGVFATPATGVVEIIGSTISNNRGIALEASTHSAGGGIYLNGSATGFVLIANSTISGNAALYNGGVRFHNNLAPTTIVNSTIVYNTGNDSGGLHRLSTSTPITIHNTIIAENKDHSGADSDLAGAVVLGSSHNLIGRGGMGVLSNNDAYKNIVLASGQYAELSPLANHGGSTKTHVPLPGSLAIDAGGSISQPALLVDQRGFARDAERPQINASSARDIGAVELSSTVGPTGDFNGDGRDDQLLFDPVTRSLNVAVGNATVGNYDVEAWGVMPSEVSASSTFVSGDFNGDGRDDVLIKSGNVYRLAISDGSTFFVQSAATSTTWNAIYAADFDGDGSDEILGGTGSGISYAWSIVNYSDAFGLAAPIAVSLPEFAPGYQQFFQDANRDGREDIITRANGSSPWMVRLAGTNVDGSVKFATAADWSAWIGYGYDNATGKLNADGAMAKVIEEFAWVYNNVELELYAGLMKGPQATEQTKAGNNWDQAALLEKRLQALGVGDVMIATGKVRLAANQFDDLARWLGVTTPSAAFNLLLELDSSAIARDVNGGNAATTKLPAVAIDFTHAWVRLSVPTANGMTSVDLDPSWKYKDRAEGITLPADFDSVRTSLGLFDEVAYLASDPESDRSLPLEFFEDQLMKWLSSSPVHRGSSLADVAYDGPIVTRTFDQVPVGLGGGSVIVHQPSVALYNHAAAVAAAPALAHQMIVRVKKGNVEHWSRTLAVPIHSLDSIQISFGSSVSIAQSNPNDFAAANASAFYSRLVVGGGVLEWGTSGESFAPTDNVTIEVVHLGPTSLVTGGALTRELSFTRKPGQIMAISLDANQHSHQSLAALQSQLLTAVSAGDSESVLRQGIDDLVVYAGAKYWADFNRHNRAIERHTRTVGVQQWVGSGIVTADPTLLLDPEPEGANDYLIEYLPYGIAPANFGVDLPNSNHDLRDVTSGARHQEAWQLLGYNSSALEHNVVEEIISAGAISTMKGLQQAFQRDMGIGGNGNPLASTADYVQEYTRKKISETEWEVRHVGNWYLSGGAPVMTAVNANITSTAQNYLLSTSTGQLRHHANHTTLGNAILSSLSAGDDVRILVPFGRTKLDSWVGGVYLVEQPNSMLLAIQADGGPPSSGGYSGGVTTAPPPQLKQGNFPNAAWAGDPVSVANGNMFRDEVDFTFPNLGTPLSFARHYDAQSKDDVGLGAGWTFTFGDVLYSDSAAPNDLVWLDSRGARHTFKWNGSNGYNLPNGLRGALRYINPNTGTAEQTTTAHSGTNAWTEFRFKSDDGTEFHFQRIANYQPFGSGGTWKARLRMQLDANGDGVKVTLNSQFPYHQTIEDVHDSSRRLTWTTIMGGGNVAFNDISLYQGGSQPVATWRFDMQVLPASQSTAYSPYRLEKVVGNYSPTGLADEMRVTSYSYHPSSVPNKGVIHRIIEPDGAWHEYEYFRNNRVFRVKQGEAGQLPTDATVDVQTFNYNLLKMQAEFTDERGNVETYIHQKNGLLTKQIHADRSRIETTWGTIDTAAEYQMTSTTDERGAVENFTYYTANDFKKGKLKTSTEKSFTPSTASVTSYDYFQPPGRPHIAALSTVIVDPSDGQASLKTSHSYDFDGRLTSTIHPNGHNVSGGQFVSYATTRTYYVTADGGPSYRLGRLKSIKQPIIPGPNDPYGDPTAVHETVFDYDAAGNVTSTTVRDAATLEVFSVSTFLHDFQGNVIQSIVGANVTAERLVTESVYDNLGRLLKTGVADANATIAPYDAFAHRYKYDALGRVRDSIDPLGRSTTFQYDRQGNVVKQINPDGTELLHEYDAFGNRVATTDALKRTTRFVYDSRNHLVQTIHPDGVVERLRYDGAGNVVASIDALGAVSTFKYDVVGRLLETKLPDPNNPFGTANPTTTNKYDKLGNLIETIDPEFNVTQFKYDKLGRVVESRTIDGREFATKSAVQKEAIRNLATQYVPVLGYKPVALSTMDYDSVGNLTRSVRYDVSHPSLITIPTEPRNLIASDPSKVQVVQMHYDAFGRPVKVVNADNTFTTTQYDAVGRVRYQRDELERVTEFRYDALGRLDKTLLPDPVTGGITGSSPTTTYRYDAVGNRIAAIDPRGFTTRFEYDVFNRLIATIDAQGNRSEALYDVAGQQVAAIDALGRSSYTLYDERGRAILQRQADPDGAGPGVAPTTHYRYNAAGWLLETVDPLGYSTTYGYDRLGRRIYETFVVDYEVIDAGDPGFTSYTFTQVPSNQPSDYGGDSALITHATTIPYALWRFDGLNVGTYRVLASWSAHPSATNELVYRLSDYFDHNAGAAVTFWGEFWIDASGANQKKATADVFRHDGTSIYGWNQIHPGYTVHGAEQTGSLGVLFAASAGQTIHLDAVRVERLASRAYQYDLNGNLLVEIDPLGRQTTHIYDELNRVVTETLPDPDGTGSGNTLLSPQTTTTYDGYGNVTRVLERRNAGSHQRTTAFQYDSRNRRIAETIDAGVDSTINYLNRKTGFQYDPVGNLTHRFEYTENAANPGNFNLLRTTGYQYDKLDRRTRETLNSDGVDGTTTALEQVTTTAYDSMGHATTIVENVGASGAELTTSFRYDAAGRLIDQTQQGLVSGQLEKRTTRFQYDAAGNETATIDPLLRVSRSEYDRLGRLVKSIAPDPDGAGPKLPETTTFVYDAAGNLVAQTNAASETKTFAYDPHGRIVRSTDGRGDVTTRRYDVAGNLAQQTDPAGNVTTYVYDGLDRLFAETTADGTRLFLYNSNGLLAYSANRDGKAVKYDYNRADQLAGERWFENLSTAQNSPDQYTDLIDTVYDDFGRLSEQRYTRRVSPGVGVLYRVTDSYLYDGLDRVVERSNQSLAATVPPRHSSGVPVMKTTYAYAAGGQTIAREQFVDGAFAARTVSNYNPFGELVKLTDGDTGTVGASAILDFEPTDAAFAYLADGSLGSLERYTDDNSPPGFMNRVRTTYAYDGAGRLASLSHARSRRTASPWPSDQSIVAFAYGYGYDSAGRAASIVTDWNTALAGLTTRADETQSFLYDDAGQLTSADSNLANRDGTYVYGPNGNRASADEPGGSDSYVTVNNRVVQDATYTYEYDAEGNLFFAYKTADPGKRTYYTWDHRNRLTKVSGYSGDHEILIVDYRYNAANELIYRQVDRPFESGLEPVEHYLVENGQRTMTFEADGDVKRRYQYGPTGEVLFDQVFDATVTTPSQTEIDLLLPLGDHQHSTRVVLAHDANDATYVRQSIDYAQFGRVTAALGANGLADAGGVVTVYAHHGSVTDTATGLQLKGERWYSTDLGRFVNEDPIQDGANWYMAFGNDPVNYADPSGLSQQGHPLSGGYSGNKTVKSAIPNGNLFGGFVDASRGRQILGLPPIPAPVAVPSQPTAFEQFHSSLTKSSSLAALTRPVDPLKSLVQQQRAIDAQRADQALSALRDANVAELAEIAFLQANRNADPISVVYRNSRAAGQGVLRSSYNAVGTALATIVGIRGISDAFSRHDAVDAHVQSGWERAIDGVTGSIQLVRIAAPIVNALRAPQPTSAPSVVLERTNAQLVQDIATRAEAKIGGTGRLAGTEKHTYAKNVLDRYQRMFGDRDLRTEISVIDRARVTYGTPGSVRLDVVEGSIANPTAIYDYKFGAAGLSTSRINQIQRVANYEPNVPIIPVRP